MPTVINKIVDPLGGGDYTTIQQALDALGTLADMVAADEQWEITVKTKSGGYLEKPVCPSVVTDATRYPRFIAETGSEYNYTDGSGVFIQGFQNFGAVFTNNSGINYLQVESIGIINTGTTSAAAYVGTADNITLANVTGKSSGGNVFDLNGVTGATISSCLTIGGTVGVRTNNFSDGTITNHTSIDNATEGFQKGTSSNDWTIKNSLYIGSGVFTTDSGWNAASDYNAASDTSAIGANSLQSRTTADLADYAGNDYKTSTSSALATAGEGGTFIGFATGGAVVTPVALDSNIADINLGIGDSPSLNFDDHFTGSQVPFSYAVTQGQLPSGLSIVGNSLTGSPDADDTQLNIIVTATDTDTNTAASNTFNINVNAFAAWGHTRAEIEASDETSGANPPFLINDFDGGDLSTDRFKAVITSLPSAGDLYVYPDSSFTFRNAPDGSYNFTYEGFKNGVSYGTATVNLVIGSTTSTFNMIDTQTPDGVYEVDYYDHDTKTLISTDNVTFSGGDASAILPVAAGTNVLMFEPGINPPTTGIAYYGVTV